VLRAALSRLRAPGVRGASGGVLWALERACIDSGRWDDALVAAREANDIAAAYKMETVAASADLATATVAAMRGDHDRVAPLLARVLATVDTSEYRGFAARTRHAAAMDALAQGSYPAAHATLETFRRLGAVPWTQRAESELRACGVTAQAPPTGPGALHGLTAQQREIVILAGQGLTNGEIADRLFLSPHTVASHLYRSYPKLGIAGRHQLRDLIDHAGTPQTSG
jgi:DNA-binding CsgD family transcriptional regulator